jgi:hypothetical protein
MCFIIYTYNRLWARTVQTSIITHWIIGITWSSSFLKKKLSYINVQFLIKRSLIIIISSFIFAQKWFFVKLSFSHHVSLHEIVYQKVKKLSFFSKSLMRRRSQIWWNDAFVKFNEITLSSILMRWRLFSSNLMSRFRQV